MSVSFKSRRMKVWLALLAVTIFGFFVVGVLWFSRHGSTEDQSRSHYEQGVILFEQRDYEKATLELRNALKLKNNMLPAWRSWRRSKSPHSAGLI